MHRNLIVADATFFKICTRCKIYCQETQKEEGLWSLLPQISISTFWKNRQVLEDAMNSPRDINLKWILKTQ